jgi:hypothetical protein
LARALFPASLGAEGQAELLAKAPQRVVVRLGRHSAAALCRLAVGEEAALQLRGVAQAAAQRRARTLGCVREIFG